MKFIILHKSPVIFRLCLLLPVLLALLASITLAQSKDITREEYQAPWRAALKKAETLNRRHIQKSEFYRDNKLVLTEEWQYEYVMPDRIHYLHIRSREGKTQRTEQINIGNTLYCKQGDAPWTSPLVGSCVGRSGGTFGSAFEHERYTVEDVRLDGKHLKHYHSYITAYNRFPQDPEKNFTSFSESVYWLNADGLLVREEYRGGRLDPQVIDDQIIDTYEYNPKDLKIEAPIDSLIRAQTRVIRGGKWFGS
jgi:hypothetical protein